MRSRYSLILACSGLFALFGCSGTSPDLGVENGQLKPCPSSPNCVSSQAADKKHAIEPIPYPGTAKEAVQALVTVLKSEERVEIVKATGDYLYVTYTSAVFRFVDDVEFHIVNSQDEGSVIQVRSASRLGYSDLGVNRKRIERIRGKLNAL